MTKTMQQQYLDLCYEIELLPPSEQQTKVITMFVEFNKANNALLVDAVNEYNKLVESRDETIRLLKEDGERLAGKLSDRSGVLDGDYIRCYFCGRRTDFDTVSTMQHDPDCPITLHNDLYKRLEG